MHSAKRVSLLHKAVSANDHHSLPYSRRVSKTLGTTRSAVWATGLLAPLFVFLLVAFPAYAQEEPTGAYQTSIPIEVPSYHGLEPNLELAYDSSADNGWLGVGWNLSGLSTIERASPRPGVPRYDLTDVFLLDGMELVPCGRVEPEIQSPSCTSGCTYRRPKGHS
jgi:hypothetical protein